MSARIEKLAPRKNEGPRLVVRAAGFAFALGTAGCATVTLPANDNIAPQPVLVAANDNVAPSPQSPPPVASYFFRTSVDKVTVAKAAPLRDYLVKDKASSHVDGLEPSFAKSLSAMFAAMPHELQGRTKILSGYRSIEHQRRLFEAAVRKYGSEKKARRWVAYPGLSMHQRGLAVDLQYGSQEARVWFHANADKFGLHFPMAWENWHIEPINARNHRPAEVRVGAAQQAAP